MGNIRKKMEEENFQTAYEHSDSGICGKRSDAGRSVQTNDTGTSGKRRKRKRRSTIRRIWILNIVGVGIIFGCFLLGKLKEGESGLTYSQLLFDDELAKYRDTIPASLLGLKERNPEAEAFVLNYPNYKGIQAELMQSGELDLSAELEEEGIPLFLQWDERWGYEKYGDDFMALNGCGPTCLSMVICGLSGDDEWNPYEVAKMADEEGYYVNGSGSSWELMSGGAGLLGLSVHQVIYDGPHIRKELQEGRPIICAMWPGDFTTAGHFIVLAGVDEEGSIIVRDPNSIKNSEKSWSMEELLPQIKNLWGYSYGDQGSEGHGSIAITE